MSSFLVLREGDNRNRWRDGQVYPDVGQGIMAPWARRPVGACCGPTPGFYKVFRRRKTRERSPALDGEKGKSPAQDREIMRGEPWLERTGRER
ncbi:hypothetical protein TNCV_1173821 [Trichonephila clavipes]|uniref:Uncharacterized protein n=1 Tax=Trichonephila clavipes TaxID=2585209 RepID=A0A8X6S7J7_TRICX|nr:hypothetical protein TNCV_1173821 [Trichonephila clavipes]